MEERDIERPTGTGDAETPSGNQSTAKPVLVGIGTDVDDEVVARAVAIAREEGRPLVIVDRGGEGILGNPYYDDLRSDDEFKPRKEQSFDAVIARREGRNDLARYLESATAAGISAGGWFPSASGLDGIREAVERFEADVLVVPRSVEHPSIGERFRGVTKENLDQLGVRVVEA